MDEVELAKNLLIKNTLKFYQVDFGKISRPQDHTELVLSMTSFEPIKYLKFSTTISLDQTGKNLKKGLCYIITNWHLENQDLARDDDFFMWGDYKIYKNELIKGMISDYSFSEEQDLTNPFSPKLFLKVEAKLIFRCIETVAQVIVPNLKSIYITQDEQLY